MTVATAGRMKRQRRSVEEKLRIVEETLEAGASVARVARRYAVNANQVFSWRKKYLEGRLGKASKLLPVAIADIPSSKSNRAECAPASGADGSMEIRLAKGQLRVMGHVEVEALRVILECLLG